MRYKIFIDWVHSIGQCSMFDPLPISQYSFDQSKCYFAQIWRLLPHTIVIFKTQRYTNGLWDIKSFIDWVHSIGQCSMFDPLPIYQYSFDQSKCYFVQIWRLLPHTIIIFKTQRYTVGYKIIYWVDKHHRIMPNVRFPQDSTVFFSLVKMPFGSNIEALAPYNGDN